jgi:uncharacterized protein YkwD
MTHVASHPRRTLVTLAVCLLMLAGFATGVRPDAAAAATAVPTNQVAIAARVLVLMNAERQLNHLPLLRSDPRLVSSAHWHNIAMAKANTMSHQVAGEAYFSARITHAGYSWHACGENIGWSSNWTVAGAESLQRTMYNEKAPYNGHRLNILSPAFRDVGVNIVIDAAHHRMWLTEDFGRH